MAGSGATNSPPLARAATGGLSQPLRRCRTTFSQRPDFLVCRGTTASPSAGQIGGSVIHLTGGTRPRAVSSGSSTLPCACTLGGPLSLLLLLRPNWVFLINVTRDRYVHAARGPTGARRARYPSCSPRRSCCLGGRLRANSSDRKHAARLQCLAMFDRLERRP